MPGEDMKTIDYKIKTKDEDFLRHERELLAAMVECDAHRLYMNDAGQDTIRKYKSQQLAAIAECSLRSA